MPAYAPVRHRLYVTIPIERKKLATLFRIMEPALMAITKSTPAPPLAVGRYGASLLHYH